MNVCFVASEAHPYIKTGGLADVTSALPEALGRLGCTVSLFLPYYRQVRLNFPNLDTVLGNCLVEIGGEGVELEVLKHQPSPAVTVYFIRHDGAFDRPLPYGPAGADYPDNARRFALLCKGCLAALENLRLRPDVIHVHDWQSALVPLYLRFCPQDYPLLRNVPTIMTIHNLAYQGLFPVDALDDAGIPRHLYTMEGIEFYDSVSFLKGGILYADAVTTVSRKYSEEIQSAEHGAGLDGVLRERSGALHGILNGVDYGIWNPAVDPYLSVRYSPEDLSGKNACKKELLAIFGLPPSLKPPVIGSISRLVDQKGFDIIIEALPELLESGFHFILLGTGEEKYQKSLSELAEKYPGRMAVKFLYDERLAHIVEGGADFFLMPSRFEPCGLNQIYSLKYGTIPIVRAVGGLDDTVENYDPASGTGNGFKFHEYSSKALVEKAQEAMRWWRNHRQRRNLRRRAMSADFSWEVPARRYLDLYRKLVSSAHR